MQAVRTPFTLFPAAGQGMASQRSAGSKLAACRIVGGNETVSGERLYRVLVVDDEASVLITYRLILERQGYQVAACKNMQEAIEEIRHQEFDLVLCDYSLDGQHTGMEVIAAARERQPDVPAVLLTGYATRETADEAAIQNINVLLKPIEIAEFLTLTAGLMAKKA
jgi:DNA-binding NtrC family response regulator